MRSWLQSSSSRAGSIQHEHSKSNLHEFDDEFRWCQEAQPCFALAFLESRIPGRHLCNYVFSLHQVPCPFFFSRVSYARVWTRRRHVT